MTENENDMKTLQVEYNNMVFNLLLDDATYSELYTDENMQKQYAKKLFESNFVSNKRKRTEKDQNRARNKGVKHYNSGPSSGLTHLSMVNNVGISSVPSSSSRQVQDSFVFESVDANTEAENNDFHFLSPTKSPTTLFNVQLQECSQGQSPSLLDSMAVFRTNPDTSDKENEVFKWDNNLIKLLLNIRLGMEREFSAPSCKKKKLWEKVAKQLNEVLRSDRVTADICDSKYRNLLGTYRVNKKKQNSTGEGPVKWECFEIMDEVLGHKASSVPPKNFLGSTMDTSLEESQIEDETAVESDAPSDASSRLSKKKEELTLNRYLFLKFQKDEEKRLEQKEMEERKWREKKEVKLKEIEAINYLASAIMSTTNNKK